MEQKAIAQAKIKLETARSAIDEMAKAKTHEQFTKACSQFLINANGIYEKLRAGSTTNVRSQQWFKTEKNFRETDELLTYLRQARNADEHGVGQISEHRRGVGINLKLGVGSLHVERMSVISGIIHIDSDAAEKVTFNHFNEFNLQPVLDGRSKKWYQLPSNHNGLVITDKSPAGIAGLAIKYLEDMLVRASKIGIR